MSPIASPSSMNTLKRKPRQASSRINPVDQRPARHRRVPHWIAILIALEASTLAIMSALHLSGGLGSGTRQVNGTGAGIAEALISVALIGAAAALLRDPAQGRRIALAAILFAILGFIIGLTFTIRGGGPIDIAYHATGLPLLVATLIALTRTPTRSRNPSPRRGEGQPDGGLPNDHPISSDYAAGDSSRSS